MKNQVIIQNLKCGGCAHTIQTELNKLEGVTDTTVNEETSVVEFVAEEDRIDTVAKRLDELGYPIENDPNNVLKKAKSYVSCAVGKMTKPSE